MFVTISPMRLYNFLDRFFDRLEDKVRGWFSHYPILYAMYGAIGIVLFWRGVWHGADLLADHFLNHPEAHTTIDIVASALDPFISFVLGSLILLSCGLFVSEFIGNEIIISGLRGEKKLTEKTEAEVKTETGAIGEILGRLRDISRRVDELEKNRKP